MVCVCVRARVGDVRMITNTHNRQDARDTYVRTHIQTDQHTFCKQHVHIRACFISIHPQ